MKGLLKKALSSRGKLFLYFLIIIVPFMTYPLSINGITIHPRKIREVCFYSFAIVICSFLQKSKWLRYLIIWCLLNWWLNFFMPNESYVILTNILSALIIYIGMKKLVEIGFLKIDIILRIICLMALFQFSWVTMQAFNIDPIFYPVTATGAPYLAAKMPLCGWSGNPVLLSSFFACSVFLFLHYFKINNRPLLFFLISFPILFLRSATVAISFTAGGLFYLVNRYKFSRKTLWAGLTMAMFLILFFIFVKHPNTDRWLIWKRLIVDGIKIRPLVGTGLSMFSRLMIIDKRTATQWFEAHNDYLQMILELGTIGFILFSGFIISRFIKFFKSEKNNKQICIMSCLVAFLVSATSLFPMHIAQLSFIAIILLVTLEQSYEVKILQS